MVRVRNIASTEQQARGISGSFSAMARCRRRLCGSIARPFSAPLQTAVFPATQRRAGARRSAGKVGLGWDSGVRRRVGRAQVLETTEASSGRILPFFKLIEIL